MIATWQRELEIFCSAYGSGFCLLWDDEPTGREGALGMSGASSHAQLYGGNVIAAKPTPHSVHSIAHEIAHGIVEWQGHGFDDEKRVSIEQIAFLDRLAIALLTASAAERSQP